MNKVLNYFKEVRAELKRVVWPTRTNVMQMTVNVIVISLIVGAYLGGLDYVFTSVTQSILN